MSGDAAIRRRALFVSPGDAGDVACGAGDGECNAFIPIRITNIMENSKLNDGIDTRSGALIWCGQMSRNYFVWITRKGLDYTVLHRLLWRR